MSRKHSFSAGFVSIVGLVFLACSGAPAAASQHLVVCDTDGQSIPAHSSAFVHCETPPLLLSTFNHITVEHVGSDASASAVGVVIQSIETTLNMLDAGNSLVDFIDLAFSPYANVDAGGQNATFGGINTPDDFTIFKNTLASDPISIEFSDPVVSVQFQLQVFVNNTTGSTQTASESLRVVADY